MRIAFIDGGTYYHHATYHDPAFLPCFERNIYICDLPTADLSELDCLWIASRHDPQDLIRAKDVLLGFLQAGKMLVVMGENGAEQWLDNVAWRPGVVNFWWWLEKDGDAGLRIAAPEHGLFNYLTLADATWHRHGGLTPPSGAVSLIDAQDDGCILFDATTEGGGRMLVTTLDPCYHHGSYFMPATTRFITGMLAWLRAGAPA